MEHQEIYATVKLRALDFGAFVVSTFLLIAILALRIVRSESLEPLVSRVLPFPAAYLYCSLFLLVAWKFAHAIVATRITKKGFEQYTEIAAQRYFTSIYRY